MIISRENGHKNRGFSLLEVMVALLLLTVTSVMIYSMLNRSIFFADRGDTKALQMEQQYAFLSLIQRQVKSGWFNGKTKKVLISGEDNLVRLATATPFLTTNQSVVMAFYRYDPVDSILYYMEKRDFYNPDYLEMTPDFDDMMILIESPKGFALTFDEERQTVVVAYDDKPYEFWPWCMAKLPEAVDG